MTYTPIDDADIKAPLAANATPWTTLTDNDAFVWDAYEPAFESNPTITSANTTSAREFRFRVRGGDSVVGGSTNGMTMIVAVRAVSSGAAVPVTVTFGDTVDTSIGVTALDWYETPSIGFPYSAEPREVVVTSAATGGPTMTYHAIRCVYEAGSSGNRYYASGWVKTPSYWYTANRAVPSEVVARLRTNPTAIARTRPICVAFHCCDTLRAVSSKSADLWGIQDVVSHKLVGRLMVPYADREERTYIVDAYTNETVPRVTARIAAGSAGATLPQATINVDSTTGFAASGTLAILTQDGEVNYVDYAGTTGTSFTTCVGGTSTLALGDEVRQGGAEFSVKIGATTETWSHTGWHSWTVRLGGGTSHALVASINAGASNAAAFRTLQVWRMEGTDDGRALASDGASIERSRRQA